MNLIYIVILLISMWLIIEILSILLKITGLDFKRARFQVISIITHTGFTTKESELIVQHPVRRKISAVLMLISYIAQASFISLLLSLFTQNGKKLLYSLILLIIIAVFIYTITKTKYFSAKFDKIIQKFITGRLMKKTRSVDEILKVGDDYAVYEILIDNNSPLVNISLKEAKLSEMNIHVLKVDRGNTTVDFPKADFVMKHGDLLIVYGEIESIKTISLP